MEKQKAMTATVLENLMHTVKVLCEVANNLVDHEVRKRIAVEHGYASWRDVTAAFAAGMSGPLLSDHTPHPQVGTPTTSDHQGNSTRPLAPVPSLNKSPAISPAMGE